MTSVFKLPSSTPAPSGGGTAITLKGVLLAPPTAANPAGYYVNIAGAVPAAGILIGDIYQWSGVAATPYLSFFNAPDVISFGGETYRKHASVWVSDALAITGLLTAAPTLSNPAGWYIQAAGIPPSTGTVPPILNDIYYWSCQAGVAPSVYMRHADAPPVVSIAGKPYRKNNGGWATDIAALTSALAVTPATGLAAGVYTQITGTPAPGLSLGDIFEWDGTACKLICTYAAAPTSITIASDVCIKWQGTWIPAAITIAKALTSTPTATTPAGVYTQIGGITPAGVALGDIFLWLNNTAIPWIQYPNAPDTITVSGSTWHRANGTWVPRTLSVDALLFSTPTTAGMFIQQTGVLPTVASGSALAYGDIYCYIGTPPAATRYLAYADAPHTVLIGGCVYAKLGGGMWGKIQQGNRDYYPALTMFREGSGFMASQFTPAGNATVVDLAQNWNGGNLLRITTDRVPENSRFDIPTSYVRQVITVTPGVDNTYFIKTISDSYRWTALHVWICNSAGVPVLKCHAQSGTDRSDAYKDGANLDPNQTSATRYNTWEWLSFVLPKDAIAANLGTSNQITIAINLDANNLENFFYIDGWAVAPNPYSLTYHPAVNLFWGLEAANQGYALSWGGSYANTGMAFLEGFAQALKFYIAIPRVDCDIYLSIITTVPAVFPLFTICNKAVSVSKKIGFPSTTLKSPHQPALNGNLAIGTLRISAADLQAFAYKNPNSATWVLRFLVQNQSPIRVFITGAYTEIA